MSIDEAIKQKPRAIKHHTEYYLTLDGKTKPLNDWAKELGFKPITLRRRLKSGWSDEAILTTPVNARRNQKQDRIA
ncbi:MAG: hypothetical protein LUD12_02725 [Lachnospiraceae bacterium]|nr:hypothetical protein [Lachnospiraceae bacterium]